MEPLEEQRKDWRSLIALSISALGMLYFLVQAISLSGLLLISVIGSQINTSEHVIFGFCWLRYSCLVCAIIVRNPSLPGWRLIAPDFRSD